MKFPGIDLEIREVQLVQLEILLEFDRICKKHNLTYHLMGGTLLGAVRENGFIPWDDDIDVSMLREDYEKFLNICLKELNSDFFLQTHKTDPQEIRKYAKIRKNDTLFIEDTFSETDIHHGVFIDIFPFDNTKPDSFLNKLRIQLISVLQRVSICRIKKACLKSSNPIKKYLSLIFHYFLKLIPKSLTDFLEICVLMFFNKKDTQYVSHHTQGLNNCNYKKYLITRQEFLEVEKVNFEEYNFLAPKNYHAYLNKIFGNYKKPPPKEKQHPHHEVVSVKL